MKRMTVSEKIFKILAYVLLTVFALCCIYPLIFTLSTAISGDDAVNYSEVYLLPIDVQFRSLKHVITLSGYWIAYSNTIFFTFYGTIVCMFIAITGAYALSKKRLLWGRGFNFLLVVTMWFNAGLVPTYQNFLRFHIVNSRFGYLIALGFSAYNIILLRNYFSSVPYEIEEAATIDGANEFQLLTKIYLPMSKASIATVTMFYALNHWNSYAWPKLLLSGDFQPLQVYMRTYIDNILMSDNAATVLPSAPNSIQSAMVICSIIPIIIIYPQLQKYFAAGVNLGGVKE